MRAKSVKFIVVLSDGNIAEDTMEGDLEVEIQRHMGTDAAFNAKTGRIEHTPNGNDTLVLHSRKALP